MVFRMALVYFIGTDFNVIWRWPYSDRPIRKASIWANSPKYLKKNMIGSSFGVMKVSVFST